MVNYDNNEWNPSLIWRRTHAPVLGSRWQAAENGAHLINGGGGEPFKGLAQRRRPAAAVGGRTAGAGTSRAGARAELQLFDVRQAGALAGKVGGEALEGVQDGSVASAPWNSTSLFASQFELILPRVDDRSIFFCGSGLSISCECR